jgi:hypothetical protein
MSDELFEACNRVDTNAVNRILVTSCEYINTVDSSDSNTCLSKAVSSGSFELVKTLVSYKADPNAVGKEHVLHKICTTNNISMKTVMIADVLIKAKADVDRPNKDNDKPLDLIKKRADLTGNPFASELIKLFSSPNSMSPSKSMESPKSARTVERSESLKKLLNIGPIPLKRPSTPPKEELDETPKCRTVPAELTTPTSPKLFRSERPASESLSRVLELEKENEKLKAENAALRDEVKRFRTTMSKFDARQQLKELYARLIQLESLESALESLNC